MSMPGAGSTAVGYAAFCGVKLAGYSLSALYFRRRHGPALRPLWLFGPARTILGVMAGALVGGACMAAGMESAAPFLLCLLPVRVLEWMLILWLFFGRIALANGRRWMDCLAGTVWSYVLDAVGIWAAFAVPGGFWVC
jgi:hypothetical protein